MKKDQQDQIASLTAYLRGVKETLQVLEQGQDRYAQSLEERRTCAGWRLEFILEQVAEALPATVRREVADCIAITKRVWSDEYRMAYEAQQKASPSCLPASDSL